MKKKMIDIKKVGWKNLASRILRRKPKSRCPLWDVRKEIEESLRKKGVSEVAKVTERMRRDEVRKGR